MVKMLAPTYTGIYIILSTDNGCPFDGSCSSIGDCALLCVCTVPRTKAFLSVTNLPRNYSDASNK